jgi:hypothetical protein
VRSHASEKGSERDFHARREIRHHAFGVERNDLAAALRELFKKGSIASYAVAGVVDGQTNRPDLNLEHIPWLGAFRIDRVGEEVAAAFRLRLDDREQGRFDSGFGEPAAMRAFGVPTPRVWISTTSPE